MCSGEGDRTLLLPGFPIRKSSDHSSVDSSPRLIAASYVLLRLLVPRHPPCALTNLATKMLASTVQFSRYGRALDVWPVVYRKDSGRATKTSTRSEAVTQAPSPSGPNSVPRRLPQDRSALLLPRQLYWRSGRRSAPTGQCSTLEHHPRDVRPRHGSGRPSQ